MRISTKKYGELKPSVQLIGDWDKTRRFFDKLPLAVKIGTTLGQKSVAEKLQKLIKQNIRRNGPPGVYWSPVSKEYAKKKKSKGFDPNKLLRYTMTYYNNIKVIHKGDEVYVGIPKKIRSKVIKKNPLTVGEVANILEKGTDYMRPRPLWAPTFRQFGGKQRVKTTIVWHIRNQIFISTGVRATVRL